MRIFIQIAVFIFSFSSFAQTDSLFDQAVLLMQKEKFKEANSLLNDITEKDSNNLSAHYNLGLSYFELQDYGNAAWAFEKCLRMDPSNSDIENALTLTYLKIDPEGVLGIEQTNVPALARIRPFVWGLLGVISSILIAFIIILFARGKNKHLNGFLAFSGVMLLLALFFSIYGGNVSSDFRNSSGKGIVISEALIYLKDLTPSNSSLPVGTVITIEDTLDTQYISGKATNGNLVIIDLSSFRRL